MERHFPFIKIRIVFYLFSLALAVASIAALLFFGLRFGIDFTGGSLLKIVYHEQQPEVADIRNAVKDLGIGEVLVQPAGEKGFLLRFQGVDEPKHREILEKLKGLAAAGEEERFTSIGPTIGKELRRKAVIAIAGAAFGIMAYIAWAFRKVSRPIPSWQYGFITASVALFHDSLIPLGFFAVLGKVQHLEVGIPFIAAMLTVLGFSVHDTIVVFDRTRENLKKAERGARFGDIVNKSLNQTLGRSLTTSLTVLLTIAAIWLLGGDTLKPFALVLFIGIAAGTYSSICIASPLLVDMQRVRFPRLRRRG